MSIGVNWKDIWAPVWKPVWIQSLVTVPDVTGETQAQATTDITALGLTVSVSTAYSSIVAAGLVISQVPAGGSQVGPGSDVAIVVSLGDQPVAPPAEETFTGGFLFAFEQEMARRRTKRREEIEREEAAKELKDEIDQEIARLLAIAEVENERQAELQRLRRLVREYSDQQLHLSDRATVAFARALSQENFSALQALERELERMLEEEEAAIMLLLNED